MIKFVEYNEVLENPKEYILIDVRSPKEFNEATIPGAVNIPLFTNEEREKIGYVYVNESVEKAKRIGIEAISARLPYIYDRIVSLYKPHKRLAFFCAKGGMRSGSISSLINSLGFNSYKLKGGYKGYRDFINKQLPLINEDIKYIVIHGKTGTGKTEILSRLREKGFDVLDLEYAANHRGSLLGNVGLGECRSQKMFESLVYEELSLRKSKYVFVEGESKRIGRIIISQCIFNKMNEGYHVYLEGDVSFRRENLLREYTSPDNADMEIIEDLEAMKKHISEKNIIRYKDMIMNREYDKVCEELMIKYYDPMYINSMKKHEFVEKMYIESIEDGVNKLQKWFEDNLQLEG
ncbi:tRNA 2-selenouridine(34) synthase MnmH [Clostridium sp. MSJ-4]|uniref:tRNA 2-selenouridine(34) synthase MnmH n=1 Tax=Clostridium simiarum TaxID=2841506 RepID=A0ABS6EYQ9_9CLOT|nr:tRNA 2-selenouridine(34) synthase MnmH [Clostridium simiarum]MBU5591138.1 tRNA 2-selenouridine(34) synthase MnmH [Clostridium simiarum]